MELTEDLIEHIEDLEGFSSTAYYDRNGVLTIGFGHTRATETFDFDEDTTVTREQALDILQKDIDQAFFHVGNHLNNANIEVDAGTKEYMTLIFFNRPWVLRKTMEAIKTGNPEIIKQSQINAYEEEKGTAEDWYINRLDKEAAYQNSLSTVVEPEDTEPEDTEPVQEKETKRYRLVGRELVSEDATAEIWSDVLQKLYGVTSPFPEIYKAPQPETKPEQSMFTNIFGKVRELFDINKAMDRQADFTKEVYDR